jgi:hypothetical protein
MSSCHSRPCRILVNSITVLTSLSELNWVANNQLTGFWVWVLCYDRRSVDQSVLEKSTHLGLTTRYLLLFDSFGSAFVERPLWRDDGSVFCTCYFPSPGQWFLGPSPFVLVTIFYCLIFETSLFVAFYVSQGHDGDIRPRLHTGLTGLPLVLFFMTTFHGPHWKHLSSILAFVLVSAGTCLPSRCSETPSVYLPNALQRLYS